MALPRDFIDELHARNEIAEVIGSYISLSRHGRVSKALCPFHSEKTASFTVFPDTQSFYCFGCNTGGDVISFVMKQDNLDYIEAVKLLADRAGMKMPENTDDRSARLRMRILEANKKAARFFFSKLNSDAGKEVRAYLRKRGLQDSSITKFGLGYSPSEWSGLRDFLRSEGFYDKELISAGLITEGKKGTYDTFRSRVMFPIIDLRGSVIAFGGRTIEKTGPKYINTQDTDVFKKSRNLFAMNIAKNTGRTIILTEGYMDVIMLHQAGFSNAVATLGTALTSEQARLISRYADEVVLCYDADEAGRRATMRAIDILKEAGLLVRVLDYSDAGDPDEYIRMKGPDAFQRLLNESSFSIEYELGKAKTKYPVSTSEGKVQYLIEASSILARSSSPTERDIYAGKLAEELGVSKQAILAQVESISKKKRRASERSFQRSLTDVRSQYNLPASKGDDIGAAAAERRLTALIFQNPDMFERIEKELVDDDFISEEIKSIYNVLGNSIREGLFNGFGSLTEALDPKLMSVLVGIVASGVNINFSTADADYLISKIKMKSSKPDEGSIKKMNSDELKELLSSKKGKK